MRAERRDLIEWLEPEIADLGYELLDLEWHRGRGATLRLYIDGADGIGLDDCTRVSRAVEALLDMEDVLVGPYRLEVSSPGLERPLRTAAHFAAAVGEEARLRVEHAGVPRKFRGRIAGVERDVLSMECDGESVTVMLNEIVSARLAPDRDAAFPARKTGRSR